MNENENVIGAFSQQQEEKDYFIISAFWGS